MSRFQKVCHLCHDKFDSDSRNEKFCVNCKEPAKKRSHARQHRRRLYQKDVTNRRAQSMSRGLARKLTLDEGAIGMCVRCGHLFRITDLQAHHRDGDPFHNDSENRVLLCVPCHSKSDVDWRKAQETGQRIPDCRNYLLTLIPAEDGQEELLKIVHLGGIG